LEESRGQETDKSKEDKSKEDKNEEDKSKESDEAGQAENNTSCKPSEARIFPIARPATATAGFGRG
jgi:hypothetical protein